MIVHDLDGFSGLDPYEETYPVFSFLLDPGKRLSIPALFGILGDAAGRDAERRGWGYHALQEKNQAWVLIRGRFFIERRPEWDEPVRLRTWPKEMSGVIAYRDFQILDPAGHVIIAGTTAWTLIDQSTRKPVRLSGEEYNTGPFARLHAISARPGKIDWPADRSVAGRFHARFGQLDMNNHVNNSRYIEWVLNELPPDLLLKGQISEVEVNFISEILMGEEVTVEVPADRDGQQVQTGFVRSLRDGRPAFAARFTFRGGVA